jgi:hypothetical protein
MFNSKTVYYGEWLLARCPTYKLEDRPLTFGCGRLLSVFAATFHSWKRSFHPLPEAMPQCGDKETNLPWPLKIYIFILAMAVQFCLLSAHTSVKHSAVSYF